MTKIKNRFKTTLKLLQQFQRQLQQFQRELKNCTMADEKNLEENVMLFENFPIVPNIIF